MRSPVVLLLPVLAAAVALTPAAAQKFVPRAIKFNGDPGYTHQELMKAAGLKKGEVLSYKSMNTVAEQLMNTGMFDGVTFKFDGQDLVFYLTPASQLFPVRIENLPFNAGEDVNAKLHALIPLYDGKVPPSGGVMESVQKDLENFLAADGIPARVMGLPSGTLGSDKATGMTFSIVSQPVLVKVAQISGVSPAFQSKVQAILDDAAKTPFDTSNSAGTLERAALLFYEDNGYAAAKVQAVRSGNAVATANSILVPYAVSVQEGRIYKLAGVQLPASAPVKQADVDKILAPNSGVPQGVRLRSLWAFVALRYKSKGYLDCTVTPRPQLNDAAGTVSYAVDVDPGPVYHLAFVKFANMSDATRMLLMRYWQMMPGDVFNQSYVGTFLASAKGQNRTLARSLDHTKVKYIETEDRQNHTVNLVIQLGG